MAITTVDGIIAGAQPPQYISKGLTGAMVAGRDVSTWYLPGIPGPGAANTTTANGVARSSSSAMVAGQIPFTDPGSGNSYLLRFAAAATIAGTMELCDRLWDCGANSAGSALSPTLTTSQTINSATWPARDNAGSTNGAGVLIGLEVSSNLGAGTPTYTLTYTNSGGTGSKTGTNIVATAASAVANTFYRFSLAAGDVGVRSVQSVQANATQTSGQWVLVAYRTLAIVDMNQAYTIGVSDMISGGFAQMFNGTVPFLIFQPQTTTTSYIDGMMIVTQG